MTTSGRTVFDASGEIDFGVLRTRNPAPEYTATGVTLSARASRAAELGMQPIERTVHS